MKVGFIGTGSMGSILIDALIGSCTLSADQIVAGNRTFEKVERLAVIYPGLQAIRSNIEIVLVSDILLLCVKPVEYIHVIHEIKDYVRPEQIVISITSPVLIHQLEEQLPCKITKIIPSITNYVLSGATLCIHGSRMKREDQKLVEQLISGISTPIHVEEKFTRITSDISSCGPAFLSFVLQRFIDAAVEETGIPQESATKLASEMLLGTGKLLTEGGFTPETLQHRVSVPGGITAAGLRLLDREMANVFNLLIQTTHHKYEEDLQKVEFLFDSHKSKNKENRLHRP